MMPEPSKHKRRGHASVVLPILVVFVAAAGYIMLSNDIRDLRHRIEVLEKRATGGGQ